MASEQDKEMKNKPNSMTRAAQILGIRTTTSSWGKVAKSTELWECLRLPREAVWLLLKLSFLGSS